MNVAGSADGQTLEAAPNISRIAGGFIHLDSVPLVGSVDTAGVAGVGHAIGPVGQEPRGIHHLRRTRQWPMATDDDVLRRERVGVGVGLSESRC